MKICAVIVTYNRLNKISKALEHYDNLIEKFDKIIVVDNCSTDGTKQFLDNWNQKNTSYDKQIVHMSCNVGGSGGFYQGLKIAKEQDFDWIWLADDDAYPHEDVVLLLKKYISCHNVETISAICGAVYYDGGIDVSHRKTIYIKGLKICTQLSDIGDYSKDEFNINAFSYVGTTINVNSLNKVGLTKKDYFIWFDDTEHSLRLSKVGDIVCLPCVKIFHDIGADSQYGLSWKDYYGERNKLDMYKSNFPIYIYIFTLVKMCIYMCFLYIKQEKSYAFLIYDAIKDFKKGKFGIHQKYKPGWKPEKK